MIRIDTTTDSEAALEQALNRERADRHMPIPMNTELIRSRSKNIRPDEVVLTTVEPNPPRPDGTTEAAGFTVRTFKNGEFFGGQIPPEVTALQAQLDLHANAQREAQAEEMFSNHAEIISQDVPLPRSVLLVLGKHPKGQWLANFLGRHPEVCEELLHINEISAEAAALEAIKRAEALSEDDMADGMTHAEFCRWRERKRQEAGLSSPKGRYR
jgi:hypothetical protein